MDRMGFTALFCSILTVIPADLSATVTPSGPIVSRSMVTFMCAAMTGDSPISYLWTGPAGQDVSLTDTDGMISITLSASGDYGPYTCTATNELGMASTTVEVIQAGTTLNDNQAI